MIGTEMYSHFPMTFFGSLILRMQSHTIGNSMGDHIKHKCKHGLIVKQCRCPGGVWVIVDCPSYCKAEELAKSRPFDWELDGE